MQYEYIVKVGNKYLYNHSPGLVTLTADIKKAGRFDCEEAARDTHRLNFEGDPFELIRVQPEPRR